MKYGKDTQLKTAASTIVDHHQQMIMMTGEGANNLKHQTLSALNVLLVSETPQPHPTDKVIYTLMQLTGRKAQSHPWDSCRNCWSVADKMIRTHQ